MALPLLAMGIGNAAGGLLGGLLGGGGPDPVLQQSRLSEEGQLGLDTLRARAARPDAAFAEESSQGIEGDSQSLLGTPEDQAQQQQALGGGPSLMGESLQDRTQKRYSGDLARLRRQNEIGAYDRKRAVGNQVYGLDMQKQQIETEMRAKQLIYQRASEEARNSVLSSVLGSAGTMVGTAIGGIKPGAAAPQPGAMNTGNGARGSNLEK